MSITNVGMTSIIDSTETTAQLNAAVLEPNIIVTHDGGTPAGDPVSVDFSGYTRVSALTSISVQNGAYIGIGQNFNPSVTLLTPPTINIDGGTVVFTDQTLASGSFVSLPPITVGPAGGVISMLAGAGATTTGSISFTGAVPTNFLVDFPNATAITGVYDLATNTTSLFTSAGSTSYRQFLITGNPFNLQNDFVNTFTTSDGGGGVVVCFLPGALIATPSGERRVEDLRIGDEVWTLHGEDRVARPLVWVGAREIEPARERDPAAAAPVRITAGAFSPGVPHTDLLVTPEHCFLFDGRLVPARMLVNGRSITVEDPAPRFTVHHVETADHAVILANGAATESYLDTGNRGSFRQPGVVVAIGGRTARSWATDAAAPLEVSAAFVEPLWRALDVRAGEIGASARRPSPARTEDPDLRLSLENGRVVRPLFMRGGRAVFNVPAGTTRVTVLSRASAPSVAIGPWVDDRRTLGVLIGDILLWTSSGRERCQTHLDATPKAGWHGPERGPHRWTDGIAELPLGTMAAHGAASIMLELEIIAGGPYIVEDAAEHPEDEIRRTA